MFRQAKVFPENADKQLRASLGIENLRSNKMDTIVLSTRKQGLELWVVIIGGALHSTHMSREMANTKALSMKLGGTITLA